MAMRASSAFLDWRRRSHKRTLRWARIFLVLCPGSAHGDVLHVSDHFLEEVPPEKAVVLRVAQFWFDGGSSS